MSSSKSKPRKLVVVGDGGVGKTCLLLVFVREEFPKYYLPTVVESHKKSVVVDNISVSFDLWDTAGQEEYSRLRPLAYPDADVILLCCAVDMPDSLENIRSIWLPEVLQHTPSQSIKMMVVLKTDLRKDRQTINNLIITDQKPLQSEECARFASELRVSYFIECSARQNRNVREVFEAAARLSSRIQARKKPGKTKCTIL